MANNILIDLTFPIKDNPITERDGFSSLTVPTSEMADWIQNVSEILNFIQPFEGVGSPDGVVEAPKYKEYIDNSGTAGSIKYIKMTDSGNTGWVLI